MDILWTVVQPLSANWTPKFTSCQHHVALFPQVTAGPEWDTVTAHLMFSPHDLLESRCFKFKWLQETGPVERRSEVL